MRNKMVIFVVVILAFALLFLYPRYLESKKMDHDNGKGITEASTEVTTEKTEATTTTEEGSTTEIPVKNDATEETKGSEHFATDATTAAERESEEAEELFRICLLFIEEYDLDSDDFQVKKAFMVQDVSHDYIYFQCKYGKTTEYACYTYDGNYFRDDLSQKEIKNEYEKTLILAKDDTDEYNAYHEFSDEEIRAVNNMF